MKWWQRIFGGQSTSTYSAERNPAPAPTSKVTDLGETTVEVGGRAIRFSGKLTTNFGSPEPDPQEPSSPRWDRRSVRPPRQVNLQYFQRYRGRDEGRLIDYTVTVYMVDIGERPDEYRLIGEAKGGGKRYSEKTFPGNQIESLVDADGVVIDDVPKWLLAAAPANAAKDIWQLAQHHTIQFEPPLALTIEWQRHPSNEPETFDAEVSDATWKLFDRGIRLQTSARRRPSADKRAWAGEKVFYLDQVVALHHNGTPVPIDGLWHWLLEHGPIAD